MSNAFRMRVDFGSLSCLAFRGQCAITRNGPCSDPLSTFGEHLNITTHAIMIGYGDITRTNNTYDAS